MTRSILALAACVALVPASIAQAQPKSDYGFTLTTPLHLLYIEQDAIRAELKLSKDQAARIATIQNSWAESTKHIDLERGTTTEDASVLAMVTRKSLGTVLTADQMKRLDQIILRHREQEHGLAAVLSSVALDLKLNAEQTERFEVLRRKRAEIIFEHLTSGERANSIRRDVHDANNDFVEKVTGLLSLEQQARLKALLGEPFAAKIELREPQTVGLAQRSGRSVYFGELWNRYALEAEILKNESVHKELKLTDDQIRKAKEFNVEWWSRYEERRKDDQSELDAVDGLGNFVMGELKEILDVNQRLRFDQIAMQYRGKMAGTGAALGYPNRASLNLEVRQIERIRKGESIEFVLTGEQRRNLPFTLGERFAGELNIKSPLKIVRSATVLKPNAVRPLQETNRLTLAKFMLENARRYRLDADQVARLKAIDEDLTPLRKLLHRELSQLPPPTDAGAARTMIPEARAVELFRKSIFDQCVDVLSEKQKAQWSAELQRARATVIDY